MNFRPFASAFQLASDIRRKKISSLELLNAYLKRVERFNPTLNAIVVTDIDRARKHARAADRLTMRGERLGPLHGVPMTLKESFDIQGLPSTWGGWICETTYLLRMRTSSSFTSRQVR